MCDPDMAGATMAYAVSDGSPPLAAPTEDAKALDDMAVAGITGDAK
jgi:hypothetical protein